MRGDVLIIFALAVAGFGCGGRDPVSRAARDAAIGGPDVVLVDAAQRAVDAGLGVPADVGVADASATDAGAPDAMLADAGPVVADPDAPGPHSTTVIEDVVVRGTRMTPVAAHVPDAASGRLGLVVFLPGFRLESRRYEALATQLASHGFIVVRADPEASLTNIDHTAMAADAGAVIDWALAHASLSARIDTSRIGVAGHSLGGKVATMTARADARVTALLGLDPVNGGHPFRGYSAELPDIVPDEVAPLTIAVGFAGETTNSTGRMPCAPADQNFETFYRAATSAPWAAMWTFDGADHMDFVDDTASCLACRACPSGTADEGTVRAAVHALVVAFFRTHLGAERGLEPWLLGARLPALVAVEHRP